MRVPLLRMIAWCVEIRFLRCDCVLTLSVRVDFIRFETLSTKLCFVVILTKLCFVVILV